MGNKNHVEDQELPCPLSQEDRERKGRELVALETQEAKKKLEKKAQTSRMTADLKTVRIDIDKIVKELDSGTELRKVKVETRFDFDASKVEYVRLDTEQVIQTRDMDSFDRQENLAYEGDALPPPKKPQPKVIGEGRVKRGRKPKGN
jgi:hypothetical protein